MLVRYRQFITAWNRAVLPPPVQKGKRRVGTAEDLSPLTAPINQSELPRQVKDTLLKETLKQQSSFLPSEISCTLVITKDKTYLQVHQ